MEGHVYPGYYGKVPANGDFVTYRLPRSFVEPWDHWLQEGIAHSQSKFGDNWLNTYLTSPVWRFGLSAGVCGKQAWAGLMLPSVDRVGRYFPLTLTLPVDHTEELFFLVDDAEEWFSQAEEVALSALDHDADLAVFKESVEALPIPTFLERSRRSEPPGVGRPDKESDHWMLKVAPPRQVARSALLLAEKLIADRFSHFSLWWTAGSEQVEPSFLLCPDLPLGSAFPAMLDGNWDRWGWIGGAVNTSPPDNAITTESP